MREHVVTYQRAAELAAMTHRTLRRRVAAGEIPAIPDPRDRRKRIIRIEDLKRYLGDVPLQKTA